MTAVPFTLCAWWCASAVLGAAPPPAGRVAIDVSAGVAVLVPTAGAGASVGLGRALGAGLRWDTWAGVAHVVTASARARLGGGWGAGLDAAYGAFVTDELLGADLSRSPFARGAMLEPVVLFTRGRTGIAAGATVRLSDPALQSAKVAVAVDLGPVFVGFQALVPLEAHTRVLGYLPTVVVGKTLGL